MTIRIIYDDKSYEEYYNIAQEMKAWFFYLGIIFSYFLVYLDNKRNCVNCINKKLIIKNNQLNSANASSIIYLL